MNILYHIQYTYDTPYRTFIYVIQECCVQKYSKVDIYIWYRKVFVLSCFEKYHTYMIQDVHICDTGMLCAKIQEIECKITGKLSAKSRSSHCCRICVKRRSYGSGMYRRCFTLGMRTICLFCASLLSIPVLGLFYRSLL